MQENNRELNDKPIPGEEYIFLWNRVLDMQDTLNGFIAEDWYDFPWYRAIWQECSEMMDREGWKWWKARPEETPESLAEQQTEVADIFHFICSWVLVTTRQWIADTKPETLSDSNGWIMEAAHAMNRIYARSSDLGASYSLSRVDLIERVAKSALNNDLPGCTEWFFELARAYHLTPVSLGWAYQTKNTLNIFRQENGYQDGAYSKYWTLPDGKTYEDNEVLNQLAKDLRDTSMNVEGVHTALMTDLRKIYQHHLMNTQPKNHKGGET